jgi:23S rRNA (guanosine2251-2'-O)-methyltransferase
LEKKSEIGNQVPSSYWVGRKPVLEALEQGVTIEKLFTATASGPDINSIKQKARELNIPISQVPVEKLDYMTKVQHQGVVARSSFIYNMSTCRLV